MANKQYSYKIYNRTGTYLYTWDTTKVLSTPSFSSQINGGGSDITLDIVAPFDDYDEFNTVAEGNIVKVYCSSDYDGTVRLVYTGVMSQYKPYTDGAKQGVRIDVLSPVSVLTRAYFKDGESYSVRLEMDPAEMIRTILTHFNTEYPGIITWDSSSIEDVGDDGDYSFNNMNWLECIQEALNCTGGGWYWNIDSSGKFHFHPKPTEASHSFTFSKDIQSHETIKSGEKIVNACLVRYQVRIDESTTEDREYYYEDPTSIATYGKRESIISDSKIRSDWTAQKRAQKEVNDNKDITTRTGFTLNSIYRLPLETILVGQTCNFLNYRQEDTTFNDNMLIASIDYSPESLRIQLEDVSNFGVEFLNAIKK